MTLDLGTNTSAGPSSRDAVDVARRLVIVYSPRGSLEHRARVLGSERSWPLGRTDETSVPLEVDDHQLSRSHCVVEPVDAGFQVRDLGSTNGTWLNGARVEAAPLRPMDVLRVGDHLLVYQELGLEASESLLERGDDSLIQGVSPLAALLRRRVVSLGPLAAPVLLLGETGAGKDVVARALHAAFSGAEQKPFVPLNCAALSAELAEAELFGHMKGAYTGALGPRLGLFREAHGGTLFLDEIGEMQPLLQAKLLRAIETREVKPVGSDRSYPAEARILAATNRDLDAEVERGHFRSDLLARLTTHVVHVPPLRERKDDLLPLLAAFFAGEGRQSGPRPSADAAEALLCHAWPRNVRELRQLAVRLSTTTERAERLEAQQLPPELQGIFEGREPRVRRKSSSIPAALLEVPKDKVPTESELRAVLEALGGNVSRAADFFGKDRRQIYRWCEKFGIVTER